MSINVTRLHAMQLTYKIDGYDRCEQRKLLLMPIHERKLYHPDNFNKTYSEIQATGMMVVGAWVQL